MCSLNPVLLAAADNARGLLAALLVCEDNSAKRFTLDQIKLVGEVLTDLEEALALPACEGVWEWRTMGHPELENIKAAGKKILVYVPRKYMAISGTHKQVCPPKLAMVHWVPEVPEATPAATPGKMAVELQAKHGGYWATDRRGIKPLKGAPYLWAHLPDIGP